MSNNYEKLICDSLLEIKTLIEECKSTILESIVSIDAEKDSIPDNIQFALDDLLEAHFVYDELIRQILH